MRASCNEPSGGLAAGSKNYRIGLIEALAFFLSCAKIKSNMSVSRTVLSCVHQEDAVDERSAQARFGAL
jgi:hypothetical protein